MAQVSVTIKGRRYQIACDDGQEAHLSRLAAYVDRRVGELVAAVGDVGDERLLVMVSLLIADELSDAYSQVETLSGADNTLNIKARADEKLAGTIDALAGRIEGVAVRLREA